MNKYEELFNEILTKTKSGRVTWKQLRRTANSGVIFNPNLVYRQFASELERNNNEFTILLIEKKYDDPEFDLVYEKYHPELLVLDGEGELVTTIDDNTVERADLLRLVNLVETKSDKAKKLFG